MPIYEYQCEYCSNQEEVLQKTTDPAPAQCRACGKEHGMKKIISNTSFQLKGGGWYNDLYASTKPKSDKPASTKTSA